MLPVAGKTIPVQRVLVPCAFCGSTGRDPFGIMSALSTCCVCGGIGTISIKALYVRCAFCQGSGVYPHSRLTCTACGGVGLSSIQEPNKTCPHCLGTGAEPDSEVGFYCSACHGAGVVLEGRESMKGGS